MTARIARDPAGQDERLDAVAQRTQVGIDRGHPARLQGLPSASGAVAVQDVRSRPMDIITPNSFHGPVPGEALRFRSGERRGAPRVGKRGAIGVEGRHVTGLLFPPSGLVRGHGPVAS
jgi:hypothetical protein